MTVDTKSIRQIIETRIQILRESKMANEALEADLLEGGGKAFIEKLYELANAPGGDPQTILMGAAFALSVMIGPLMCATFDRDTRVGATERFMGILTKIVIKQAQATTNPDAVNATDEYLRARREKMN